MIETPHDPQRKPIPTLMFLETSAQIQRLVGTQKMQDGINYLVKTHPKPAIGTSATVKREFDHICNGLFRKLEQAALTLPKPASLVPFEDLLLEIKGQVGPYHPGGEDFLIYIYTKLASKFGGHLFTVNRIRAVFDALKTQLQLRFLKGEFFDKSSCGVWEARRSCRCELEHRRCLLEEITVQNRENFLDTATTLATAGRDESPRLKKILDQLKTAEGKALSVLLGKHRGHVADLIIFWEVPDGWTILSRDLTFKILSEKHRASVDFYMVRLPREKSDTPCKLRLDDEKLSSVDGVLLNYNAKGARVHAPSITVKEGQSVTLISAKFEYDPEGQVSPFDSESDLQAQPSFGLKFKKPNP